MQIKLTQASNASLSHGSGDKLASGLDGTQQNDEVSVLGPHHGQSVQGLQVDIVSDTIGVEIGHD